MTARIDLDIWAPPLMFRLGSRQQLRFNEAWAYALELLARRVIDKMVADASLTRPPNEANLG